MKWVLFILLLCPSIGQSHPDSLLRKGIIYTRHGDYSNALEKIQEALTSYESENNEEGIAYSYIWIGTIHRLQNNFNKAIEYHRKAKSIFEMSNNHEGLSNCYNELGLVYEAIDSLETALEFHTKALEIREDLNDTLGMADSYSNLGTIYKSLENYELAIEYQLKTLEIDQSIGTKANIAITKNNLGSLHILTGDMNAAYKFLSESLELSLATGARDTRKYTYLKLAELYYELGEHQTAYNYYVKYSSLKDSLLNDQVLDVVAEMEAKYENEKNQLEIKSLKAERELQDAEDRRQNTLITFLICGFSFMVALALLIYKSFRNKKRDNKIISQQKELVDLRNREILDSIQYAKRIQSAILPPKKIVKEYLNNSFILYKPKDIVAGDFYWLEHKDGKVLFAACDCTGHGVPGAMVSVVCNNGLNRSVREYGLTDPAAILNKTREIVIQEFEKSEEEVKDGMDIALCTLQDGRLEYAGANNPLWIIRKDAKAIDDIRADKQPIGKYANPRPYTTHKLMLNEGDTMYIFSDGFADQFGGDKGKKFKAANFKNLLLSIQNKTMDEQRLIIDEAFENWRGSLEQLDDVCVIGVRV